MIASPTRKKNDFTHVLSCLLFRDIEARDGGVAPGTRKELQATVSHHLLHPTWSSVHIWTCKNKPHFHLFLSFMNAGSTCISKQNIYVSLKWLARSSEQTNENKQMYVPVSQWLLKAFVFICSWKQTKKKGLIWMKDSCILYFYFHSNKCSCLPSMFSSHSIIPNTPRQGRFELFKFLSRLLLNSKSMGGQWVREGPIFISTQEGRFVNPQCQQRLFFTEECPA